MAQLLAAVLLLVEVVIRFVYFLQLGSLPNYVLTFYSLFFAFYLIGFELGIKRLKLKFYLMNFGWGKAAMNLFLASLIVSSWTIPIIDIIILIVFSFAFLLQVTCSIMFRAEERERIEGEVRQLEEYRETQRRKETEERAAAHSSPGQVDA